MPGKQKNTKSTKQAEIELGLKNLETIKDEDINYSDIPELDDEFFEKAIPFTQLKTPISIRIDSDILDWLKKQNKKGYQTHINKVLRTYMETFEKKQKNKS